MIAFEQDLDGAVAPGGSSQVVQSVGWAHDVDGPARQVIATSSAANSSVLPRGAITAREADVLVIVQPSLHGQPH